MSMNIPTWPAYTAEEIQAVTAVLSSNRVNYWTGIEGRAFEREFAEWANTSHAVCLANGTLALDLALNALDIGEGDEVIVSPRSFIASVSTVVNAGANPVFADVDLDSGNLSVESVLGSITERTKAIIPVHLGGWPADVVRLANSIDRSKIVIIEDCAQAHGARIGNRSVGSIGDIGAWSFCQDKIMTTGGEGGMVTTDRSDLWRKMWSFKDHGKDWDKVYNAQHPPGFRFVHESFGTNWRLSEMQSAIGRIQVDRMPQWHARRMRNANLLAERLEAFSSILRVPMPEEGFTHAFYRLYGYIRSENLRTGWNRDRIVQELSELGVPTQHGSCSEIYLEAAFDGTTHRPRHRMANARELGETSIAFMVHPTLGDEDMLQIAELVEQVFSSAMA